MTDEVKLYQAYYQLDRLWTGNKAITELHKVMSISKKRHQIMVSQTSTLDTNGQHQFDILFMPHNVFKGNTHKYILTGIDVASRYKVARPL